VREEAEEAEAEAEAAADTEEEEVVTAAAEEIEDEGSARPSNAERWKTVVPVTSASSNHTEAQ
jgi:hypothetical protein